MVAPWLTVLITKKAQLRLELFQKKKKVLGFSPGAPRSNHEPKDCKLEVERPAGKVIERVPLADVNLAKELLLVKLKLPCPKKG